MVRYQRIVGFSHTFLFIEIISVWNGCDRLAKCCRDCRFGLTLYVYDVLMNVAFLG